MKSSGCNSLFRVACFLLISIYRPVFNSVTTKSDYFKQVLLNDLLDTDSSNSSVANQKQDDPDSAGSIVPVEPPVERNFIDFYVDGVQAYLENDFESCINHLERSLNLYRQYEDTVANCRVQCEFERIKFKNTHPHDYDHIHFYEKLIVKTLCLEKCRQQSLSHLPRYFQLEPELKEVFKKRKPYEYLQLCYYQEGEIEKAISATYTALVGNPDDELMKKNIQYYVQQKDFDWEKMRDLEDKRYSFYYQDGVEKYDSKEWHESIQLFEIAIDAWLQEHDKCRALCDSEFEQGWLPDFITASANHYVFTLRCKQNCTNELSYLNGRFYEDLFPSMYNYLQFSYYNDGHMEKASRCAASYLLFYPDNEEMIHNVEYYKQKDKGNSKNFSKPRKEALAFYERAMYEVKLLSFTDTEFFKLSDEPFRTKHNTDNLTDRQIDDIGVSNVIPNDV